MDFIAEFFDARTDAAKDVGIVNELVQVVANAFDLGDVKRIEPGGDLEGDAPFGRPRHRSHQFIHGQAALVGFDSQRFILEIIESKDDLMPTAGGGTVIEVSHRETCSFVCGDHSETQDPSLGRRGIKRGASPFASAFY